MWEDKRYTSSVPKAEVEKGLRDIAGNPDCHILLFVSASSGIVGREGMSGLVSEVRNGQLIVYISNFKRNADQIGYLRTVVQNIILGVKPLLLQRDLLRQEQIDDRLEIATNILATSADSLVELQKMCDSIASESRIRQASMKNSIERVRAGLESLSKSLLPASTLSEPGAAAKAQRKCSKCGQPGHTIKTCKA
jgi:hypothetical protein